MEILGLIDVPVWLLLVVLLVVTLYLYTSKDYGYFKSVGIPGPKPKPFIGNGLDFLKNGIMEHDLDLKRKYGKAVGVFFPGNTPAMFVYDEEMLSEITVKKFQYFTNRLGTKIGVELLDNNISVMEDAEWKSTRSIMSPVFTTGKLRKMASEVNRCAKQLTSNLTTKDEFDAKEVTAKFAMDVIASTAFGLRINSQEDGDNPFVENAKGIMNISLTSPLVLIRFVCPPLSIFLAKLGLSIFPKKTLNFFENVITQTFKNRTSSSDRSENDFVRLMLNAQAGEDIREETEEEESNWDTKQSTPQGGLSNKVIVSNAFLFFFAGFHTTSQAIRMLMYNLTVHPEYQDKVIEEVESNVGDEEIIMYDMISAMTYLDKCLCETLRMYPPAPRSDRIVKEDVTICGVPFKKGSVVWLPIYALQNDPDIWPEPKKFDPERFSPEEKAKRNPFHWMPFGYGPRNCIGLRLAMYEMKVAIVEMLREHRLVRCEKTQVPLQFVKGKYLESDAGIWLKLEKRNQK